MAKLNKTCAICHKNYKYCPTCTSDINKPAWMSIFCCENCKNLYNTINDYRYKLLSKEEAFNKLKTLDLSSIDELPENFKAMLKEILDVGRNKEDVIIEDVIIEEPIDEMVAEEPIIAICVKDEIFKHEAAVIEEVDKDEIIEEIKKPRPKKKVKSVE